MKHINQGLYLLGNAIALSSLFAGCGSSKDAATLTDGQKTALLSAGGVSPSPSTSPSPPQAESFCSFNPGTGTPPSKEALPGTWIPTGSEILMGDGHGNFESHCSGYHCCKVDPAGISSLNDLTFYIKTSGNNDVFTRGYYFGPLIEFKVGFNSHFAGWGGANPENIETSARTGCEVPTYNPSRLICNYEHSVDGMPAHTREVTEYKKK